MTRPYSMKKKLNDLAERYADALRTFVKQGARAILQPALELGQRAVSLGMGTLALARIHDRALAALNLPDRRMGAIRRAEKFFAGVIGPTLETHRVARQNKLDLKRLNTALGQRTAELAVANRKLQQGIARRKLVDAALRSSGKHHARLLQESIQLQAGLRQLAHQVLLDQEDDRMKISRGLQDEIVQTLLGINLRLVSLKQQDRNNTQELENGIANTQRVMVSSIRSVGRVANEFGDL